MNSFKAFLLKILRFQVVWIKDKPSAFDDRV